MLGLRVHFLEMLIPLRTVFGMDNAVQQSPVFQKLPGTIPCNALDGRRNIDKVEAGVSPVFPVMSEFGQGTELFLAFPKCLLCPRSLVIFADNGIYLLTVKCLNRGLCLGKPCFQFLIGGFFQDNTLPSSIPSDLISFSLSLRLLRTFDPGGGETKMSIGIMNTLLSRVVYIFLSCDAA